MTSPARLLSTLGGSQRDAFIAQFQAEHAGTGVQLVITLHPALHHGHLAQTVAEVLDVAGVQEARWLGTQRVTRIGDELRVRLANYRLLQVRDGDFGITGDGDLPVIALYHRGRHSMLVSCQAAAGDGQGMLQGINQSTLDLCELVDQALRDETEYDAALPTELDLGLRCGVCGLIRHSGCTAEHARTLAGQTCGVLTAGSQDGPCPGALQPVLLSWTPTDPSDEVRPA